MPAPCIQPDMFLILLTEMHVCVHKIDDIEAIMQSTRVNIIIRRVHDNLHEHACMSVMYTPNLFRMHVDVCMNFKLRMVV